MKILIIILTYIFTRNEEPVSSSSSSLRQSFSAHGVFLMQLLVAGIFG